MKTNLISEKLSTFYFNPVQEVKDLYKQTREKSGDFKFKPWMIGFLKLAAIMIITDILMTFMHFYIVYLIPGYIEPLRLPLNKTILAMLLLVILEEFMFRLPMKHNYLFLFIAIYALAQYFVPGHEWSLYFFGRDNLLLRTSLYFATTVLIFPIMKIIYKPKLMTFWMVVSCIGFALAHLRNYPTMDFISNPVYALVTIPQLLAGIILLYARLKQGVGTSILLHFCSNGLLMFLSFICGIFE